MSEDAKGGWGKSTGKKRERDDYVYQGKPLETYTLIQGVHDVLHELSAERVFCLWFGR
jgi:hypothetical protein